MESKPSGCQQVDASVGWKLILSASDMYASLMVFRFPINNTWTDVGASFMADKVYVVQTVPRVLQRCLLMTTDPSDSVLDPTCGSGITVYVAEQWAVAWMTLR